MGGGSGGSLGGDSGGPFVGRRFRRSVWRRFRRSVWRTRHSADAADEVVPGVRDVEVAVAVQRNPRGSFELRRSGRAAVAAVAARPRAGKGGDDPGRGVHLADAVVASVRDVEVAVAVQRNPRGSVERRRCGRAAVAAVAARPRAGEGGDDPGRGVHLADAVVANVRDVEVVVAIQRNPSENVERRRSGRAAVAAVATRPRAGEGGDDPGRGVHLADAVVANVRDVEVVVAIQRNPSGKVERRRSGRAAVAVVADPSRAGEDGDDPGRGVHLADAVVFNVRDVEVVVAIQRNPRGSVERRRCGRAAVAAVAVRPRAGEGGDDPGRGVHLADAVVVSVRDVEVAVAVQRNPRGSVELRRSGRAAVAAVRPRAGEGGDDPGRGVHLADAVVARVRDVEVSSPSNVLSPASGRAAVAAIGPSPLVEMIPVEASTLRMRWLVIVRDVEVAVAVQPA